MTSTEKMTAIAAVLDEKKAEDIKILKISELTTLADYFIICSAHSMTQVNALTDYVDEKLDELNSPKQKREGKAGQGWMLLDYGDVVVHIFYQETRDFYNLEKLWADAEIIDISDIVKN